jgi:hypothetical protein
LTREIAVVTWANLTHDDNGLLQYDYVVGSLLSSGAR